MQPAWILLIAVTAVGVVVLVVAMVRVGRAVADLRRSMLQLGEAGVALQQLKQEGSGLGDSIEKVRRH